MRVPDEERELLMSIQYEMLAHREVLAFTLATLEGFGHARADIAAALKDLKLDPRFR
jgi:hypothetical protein